MTADLLIASAVMILLSLLFVAASWRAAMAHWPTGAGIASVATAILLLHAFWLKDNLLLARLIPSTNVIIWGNWALPAAALLAGSSAALLRGPRWQRIVFPVAIYLIGLYRLTGPLFGAAPPLGSGRVIDGLCRQSSDSSCSAAAAVTLLLAHQIPCSEAELVRLCLTHRNGTTMLGLYRGIAMKADRAGARLHVGSPTINELSKWPLPAILSISLRGNDGWIGVGNAHSVVVYAIDPVAQTVDIGDPFAGRQRWTLKQLADVYGHQAIAIESQP